MQRTITIQGILVTIEDLYQTGHVCSDVEANALNQTRAEGIRNNLAKEVKAVLEIAGKDAEGNQRELSETAIANLQEKINSYSRSYVFSSGGRTSDPIQKEAKSIAKQILEGKLADQGVSLKDYPKDKFAANLEKIMAMDAVQKRATKTVADSRKLGAEIEL
jgi:hypothetical protein